MSDRFFLICPRAFHETIRTQIIQDMRIDLPSRYENIENITLTNEMRLSTLACNFHWRGNYPIDRVALDEAIDSKNTTYDRIIIVCSHHYPPVDKSSAFIFYSNVKIHTIQCSGNLYLAS